MGIRALGGATYGHIKGELTLQGRSEDAVVLRGIEISDVERASLPPQPAIVSKCDASGGAFDARLFDLEFGGSRAKVVPEPGLDDDGNVMEPAVDFPYKTLKSDPEVFYLLATGSPCVCSYRLSIRWSSGDESGTVVVDRGFDKLKTAIVSDEESIPFNVWGDDGSWETY